jgi:cathepsin L
MKFLIFSVIFVVALAKPNVDLKKEFEDYKQKFNKQYLDDAEESMRFEIFARIFKKIEINNKAFDEGLETFEMGLTKFSDMTKEEQKRYLGLKIPKDYQSTGATFLAPENIQLPDKVDWRKKGYVTPVKNQEDCGSCWAFSATGSLEGQHFKKSGKLVSLSEQNLVDCVVADDGCDGGLMDDAFDYINKNGGIDTEASYPYEAVDQNCEYKKQNSGATDMGHMDIKPYKSEKSLQKAVATVGPISVAINAASDEFMNYKKGILKFDCPGDRDDLDHGVLAVGYGTMNHTLTKKHHHKGGDYWIVKNSWGTDWAEMGGYVLMARNYDNMCGISTLASYPIV